jgi:hypothetical protein
MDVEVISIEGGEALPSEPILRQSSGAEMGGDTALVLPPPPRPFAFS